LHGKGDCRIGKKLATIPTMGRPNEFYLHFSAPEGEESHAQNPLKVMKTGLAIHM
jgi:hypothetical protein